MREQLCHLIGIDRIGGVLILKNLLCGHLGSLIEILILIGTSLILLHVESVIGLLVASYVGLIVRVGLDSVASVLELLVDRYESLHKLCK